MDWNYIAVLMNSSIRLTTPVLLAALGSAICSRAGVFNIALEGQMLISCFTTIAVNIATNNLWLASLAGVLSGVLVATIVAVLQVRYKGADMVIGTSINLFVSGLTSILLMLFFGLRGRLVDNKLLSLPKINLPVIRDVPFLGSVLKNMTIIDYSAYLLAIVLFFWLFRTVSGFHVRSVGMNPVAARSLGIRPVREQMKMVIWSGALCGLGGVVLCIGQVTMFLENMTAGRGFVAMAAATMGGNHPIYVILSSLFFGFAQGLGTALQTEIPSQLTLAFPYIMTIVALMITGRRELRRQKQKRKGV